MFPFQTGEKTDALLWNPVSGRYVGSELNSNGAKTLFCIWTEGQKNSFSGVQMVKAQRHVGGSGPQLAAQSLIEQYDFWWNSCVISALSSITVSPMAPQEDVDILSQDIHKSLLSGDILGSTHTEHINYINNIANGYLNVLLVRDLIFTMEFNGIYFNAPVVFRHKLFL